MKRDDIPFMVTLISASFSVVGASALIFFAVRQKKHRLPVWRAIITLSIYDLCAAIILLCGAVVALSGQDMNSYVCNIQGFCVAIFQFEANFSVLLIAVLLYLMVVQKLNVPGFVELLLHLISYPINFFIAFLPYWTDLEYTDTGAWCWLKADPVWGRYISVYMWVWSIILIIVTLYLRMAVFIRSESKKKKVLELSDVASGNIPDRKTNITRDLFLYPIAFIVLWIPNSLNRILQSNGIELYAFVLIEAFCLPFQGCIDAIVFGFSTGTFSGLMNMCSRKKQHKNKGETVVLVNSQNMDYYRNSHHITYIDA